MRVIHDRAIKRVLVAVEVPVLVFIAVMYLTNVPQPRFYSDREIEALCTPAVQSAAWEYLVLHHSATSAGSAGVFGRYHRQARGWEELGYHFVIGNGRGSQDGRVEVGDRWTRQKPGAHAGSALYNTRGIGVCLVGNFSQSQPTPAQYDSLLRLCTYLMRKCGIPLANVKRHREVGSTECPGVNFPFEKLLGDLRLTLAAAPGEL